MVKHRRVANFKEMNSVVAKVTACPEGKGLRLPSYPAKQTIAQSLLPSN